MVKIDGNITYVFFIHHFFIVYFIYRATNARMVTLEKDMKLVKESLARVEQLDTSIDRTLKGIAKKQNRKAVPCPSFLPFKTSADILAFNYASEEDYNTLVEYLSSQGGANFTDSAAIYFRECIVIDQDIFRNVTWSTSKAEGTMALKDTRFANACKDSMPADKTTLRAPEPTDFKVAMMKALKSAKEAFRRKMKRPADNPIEPPPPIHRPRVVLASDLDEEQDGEQSAGSEDDNDEEQDTESKSGTDDESGTESEVDDDDAGITDGEISDQGDDNDDDHTKRDYASDASEIFNNF
ncbi:pheromone-processing carboxypeptidase KEX1 isoform X1 [Nasonia vitripennis]|uniref:Uncharacterized protein n=2 Tax=Nasonia vitripennis TaxID=7425 RepID=A0A7M7QFJ5_NASVI|nr:pheromone-processing carboxypeptidase KEX1 isoform X1 [Nasonia vitripennis]XP_031785869.1 pheromone-processing carboxypeptidase KEX1 isoform X1 [Nasonia vitripennis]XP_031785870.1 pheromone-processing carboxypeptidase KEX1 isoform X1 [Nasonia vitripennis]